MNGKLPLYKRQEPVSWEPDGHAGLWFDKFCNKWQVKKEDNSGNSWTLSSKDSNPKLAWIQTVTGFNNGPVGIKKQLTENVLRLIQMIQKRGGQFNIFKTESRFVTGMGLNHPIENGFAWHPTLGTPYLPGSSVKGLIRSWVNMEVNVDNSKQELLDHFFGDSTQAGDICFLDAIPVNPVQLEADIMTPHYAGWSEKDPPGDWRSPTPIPFLTTAADTSFLFGIIPCQKTVNDNDLQTISHWLIDALQEVGVGAKTAIGYGRFIHDKEKTDHWVKKLCNEDQKRIEEKERHEAMKTPEGRWQLELKGKTEQEILDLVRIHLNKESSQDPSEIQAFADAVNSTGMVEHWRRGETKKPETNTGKKKLKERARWVATYSVNK